MNKKLVTLAVAAAMAAPGAALAEAVLYGKLNVSIDYADVTNAPTGAVNADDVPYDVHYVDRNGNPAPPGERFLDANGKPLTTGGVDFSGWGISARGNSMPGSGRGNRIGIKGSEDLGNGLDAIYQVEFSVDNMVSGSGVKYRNSFVGVAGDFGTVLAGRHDTPLKMSTGKLDLFGDTMADYNGTIGFDDVRAPTAVAYISPSISGLSFAGAIHTGGGGGTVGPDNIDNTSLAAAYSLALIYSNGPFYGSAAYEAFNKDIYMDSETSLRGSQQCLNADGTQTVSCNYVGNDYKHWRLGLGMLDWNGFTLTAIYEQQDDLPDGQTRSPVTINYADGTIDTFGLANGTKKQRLWQVQAGYSFGNNMVKAMYGSVDRTDAKVTGEARRTRNLNSLRNDLSGDRSAWAIGFHHNFSKRTKAYAVYTNVSDDRNSVPGFGINDGRDWNGFSLGLVHKF